MATEGSSPAPVVHHLSKSIVRPSSPQPRRNIHLTSWDLRFLSIQYIQKGILLPKPQQLLLPADISASASNVDVADANSVIRRLNSSLSIALDRFYPLAGRLSITHHTASPQMLSVSIDCNNEGAEFTFATIENLITSDVLSSNFHPIIGSLFPLKDAVSIQGHSLPLFAAQATVLADGAVFLACSFNHAVGDGTVFWHFLNSWSAISRNSADATCIDDKLMFDRWFLPNCHPPIKLPFLNLEHKFKTEAFPALSESVFLFSANAVKQLKSEANARIISNTTTISSLQALLAHVWICVSRARQLQDQEQTSYSLAVGCRSRLNPPLPAGYLGNCIMVIKAEAIAGELLNHGLGWAAKKLNDVIGEQTDNEVRKQVESWVQKPQLCKLTGWKTTNLLTGSSPRFDVYGNDFGWGRPLGVRSGGANKFDGKVTVFPGPEVGSIALELCLSPSALSSLMEDDEFLKQ